MANGSPQGAEHLPAHHRIQFDPRINLGHILTTISLLGALVVGWSSMDKRISKVESSSSFQAQRLDAVDAAMLRQRQEVTTQIQNLRTELRTDLRDISSKLDRVLDGGRN